MPNKELNEVFRYFQLLSFEEENSLLEDEYEELEEIKKRNKVVQFLESQRLLFLQRTITEEEYNAICDKEIAKLKLK